MARYCHLLCLGVCLVLPACTSKATPPVSIEQTAHESAAADVPERAQHLVNLGIEPWHRAGLRGQHVKIAVLDSGFRDFRQFLGNGLPRSVRTRSFRKDRSLEARDSQHGILCAEVLHALAPDAELLLVNWEPDDSHAFLEAVRWAKSQGARIASCSLIMPSWSDGEGGGEVQRGLGQILGDGKGAGDLLFFASAGNTAQRHWCGDYAPDADGWHQWRERAPANTLTPWGSERVAVEFYGPTRSAFEVQVIDAATSAAIGRSQLQVDATGAAGRAVVRFEPTPGAVYQVKVRCVESRRAESEAFHLVALGASLEHTTNRGSIPFPGDGAHVLAVGAVDVRGERLAYSSCGPNSRLPKPDLVATVPFPSLCRARPFAGTSAAAPQAAGLAALLWSQHPDWLPEQIALALREAALDLGPPGHDPETGYGLIRLPK
jgi:Subtilase family